MPDPRRTSSRASGPRGRTGPGRVPRPAAARPGRPAGTAARPGAAPGRGRGDGAAGRAGSGPRRPRFTSRAAVLVLVLAVLAVSYASSARAYLQQRAQLDELRSDIEQREESIARLEREMRRWEDPAYVQQEARALGYVMPGETSYVVLDEDGEPLEQQSELGDPDEVGQDVEPAFWEDAWASVLLAGHPPVDEDRTPVGEIDGTESDGGSQE